MPWTRRKFITSGILAGLGFSLLDACWLEKYFIETNESFLGKSGKEKFDLKVIQLSDLHLQSVNSQLKRLARKINTIRPDLVLITGDAVDKREHIDVLDQFLTVIDRSIRKVAILGNWEYWGAIDLSALRQLYANHNGELLINQTRQYTFRNKTVSVTGVDDFVGGKADIATAVSEFKTSDYHIILNHCPEYGDVIASTLKNQIPYDVILSGHTHGGQINLFGIVPFKPVGSGRYLKGWYHNKTMYVSKGIGTSILPMRFMARAEMAVFAFLKEPYK
jgi:predicted MPP superfamily phosphohydrolase